MLDKVFYNMKITIFAAEIKSESFRADGFKSVFN